MNLWYTPDGKTLVSAGRDHTLRAWDTATGREVQRLKAPSGALLARYISATSPTLAQAVAIPRAAGDGQGRFYLCNLASLKWEERHLQDIGPNRIDFRSCSPDGRFVVTMPVSATQGVSAPSFSRGIPTVTLRLSDTTTGKKLFEWTIQGIRADLPVFSPNGQLLAYTAGTSDIELRSTSTGRVVLRLTSAIRAPISRPVFSPGGRMVAAMRGGNGIQLWEVPSGNPLPMILENRAMAVIFAPDSKTIAVFSMRTGVTLWDIKTGKERQRWPSLVAESIAFAPAQDTLATSLDGAIHLWDIATGKERHIGPPGYTVSLSALAVSGSGTVATAAGGDVRSWNIATGQELGRFEIDVGRRRDHLPGELPSSQRFIRPIALAPDGTVLATSEINSRNASSTIRLFNVASGKEVQNLSTKKVYALSISPDGKTIALKYDSGPIGLWELASGRERCEIEDANAHLPATLAWTPDGRFIVRGSLRDITFFDAAQGREANTLHGQPPHVGFSSSAPVAVSPNHKMLVTADSGIGQTSVITVWELASGQVRARLSGHAGMICALAFANDSRTLVSGSDDTTALVWDLLAAAPAHAERLTPDRLEALWTTLASEKAVEAYGALAMLAQSPDGAAFLGRHLAAAAPDTSQQSPEWLRWQRGFEALEMAGTPQSRQVRHSLERDKDSGRLIEATKSLRIFRRPGS